MFWRSIIIPPRALEVWGLNQLILKDTQIGSFNPKVLATKISEASAGYTTTFLNKMDMLGASSHLVGGKKPWLVVVP